MFAGKARIDASGEESYPISEPRRLRLADALLMTIWFGLLTGLIEVAVKAVQKFGFDQTIYAGRDFVWMAPLTGLVFFAIFGLALFIVASLAPRLNSPRLMAFVVAMFSLLNLLFLYPQLHHYAALPLAIGGAVQISRIIASREKAFHGLVRRTIWLLVGVVALLAAWAQVWPAIAERRELAKLPPAPAQAPNVLFIVLDTVRAHNLSVYGYGRATTPNLEQLAKSGVVFDRALSTAPWTLPSHAGMFTGRFAHELSANWKTALDGAHPTLAEQFSKRGYLTAGFIANTYYCSYEHGLNRGFDHYEDYQVSLGQMISSLTLVRTIAENIRLRRFLRNDEHLNRQSADEVNDRFLRWLPHDGGRPFFAFLNLYDAHEPYLPPAPFDRKFGPGRSKGKLSPLLHSFWNPVIGVGQLSKAEWQEEVDAYDGAIAYLDHQLGQLFADLKNRGLYDNTLIIVTSDHGEEFNEHGLYSHGNSLYLPSVHVPLLITLPGRTPPGHRVTDPVSLRDLPATVSELAGLQTGFPGQTLTRFWARPGSVENGAENPRLCSVRQAPEVPEWYPVSKGDMSSLVREGYRYIRNGDGREELYDFEQDPWERNNLAERAESLSRLEWFRTRLNTMIELKP
ncbi:MAG: sulfatase [Blastocatellales bacterium]